MASVSLIYDGIISLVGAQLPTYTRLPDAYEITNNDLLRIVKGYSLGFSSGLNTERNITCDQLSSERNFTLSFTNIYTANELDPVARSVDEKALLEDAFKVWKAFQTVTSLGTIQVANAKYVEDSGIQYLYNENHKAISIVSAISVEYFE